MSFLYGRVALVVGASSGMGKACAEYLKEQGYYVYGTSRRAEFPADASYRQDNGFLTMIPLDVTNDDYIKRAIDFVIAQEGQINVLLNCAGYALGGAIEDISREEAHLIFDTNMIGMMMVCRQVLPHMRAQQRGLIVNIGSVAGLFALPFQSMYSATKYAVEAMTESLRMEVKPFGIKVSLIDPGDISTGFTKARQTAKAALTNPVYRERHDKAVNAMIKSELNGPGPEIVVRAFARILKSKNPPVRVITSLDYQAAALAKRLVPARLVEFIIERLY
ncbi:MAG TPA: SDR family oxidoreductase [Firmicutes bacterium]|nr:SDR family oxidoreductase [Bacillota bacterium]